MIEIKRMFVSNESIEIILDFYKYENGIRCDNTTNDK